MNFDNFKYNKDKIPADVSKKQLFFADLKDEFIEELLTRTEHEEYFNKYDPDSVKAFLLSIADLKIQLASYYYLYADPGYQDNEVKYSENAESLLKIIRQKQLFNLQLQWRAEQITIKEITTSWDFLFWEFEIDSCPFLPGITYREVTVLKQFLNEPYVDSTDLIRYGGWQQYTDIMERDEEGDLCYLPEWYEFYDEHMGTGHLMLLPNTRGDKEEYYREVARNSWLTKEKVETANKNFKPVPSVPRLFGSFKNQLEYAERFESDPHFKELFRLHYQKYKHLEEIPADDDYSIPDEYMYDALYTLLEAKKPVPMPAGANWREAMIQCARQYINSTLAADIDNVYEDYRMYTKMGINKGKDFKEVWKRFLNDSVTVNIRSQILLGRKLLGEPENFNF
jgi:hypothetical protein